MQSIKWWHCGDLEWP